jgi:DNA-binding CsgD family transcriptional regulator
MSVTTDNHQRGLVGTVCEVAEFDTGFSVALRSLGWQAAPVNSAEWNDIIETAAWSRQVINLVVIVDDAGRIPASLPTILQTTSRTSVILLGRRRNFGALAHAVERYSAVLLDADQPFYDLLNQLTRILEGTVRTPRPRTTATRLYRQEIEAARFFKLSLAERHVLSRLLSGLTVARIADTEKIEITTVRSHMRSIFSKIGVHSQVELVAFASQLCPESVLGRECVANVEADLSHPDVA